MVQDMISVTYLHLHDGSIATQTPMVIVPSPLRAYAQSSPHTKRPRMEITAVVAQFYYDLYPGNHQELRLNEWVELIGVVDEETPWQDEEEGQETATFPRLHVLCFSTSLHPTLDSIPPQLTNPACDFSQALGVDATTAHALATTFCARAERTQGNTTQTPHGTTLGCASLLVQCGSTDDCATLCQRLEAVAPNAVYWKDIPPLPQRSQGRLALSPWQLPAGCTLIVQAEAVPDFFAAFCRTHHVEYQFDGGVRLSFGVDVPIVVVSTQALPGTTLQVRLSGLHDVQADQVASCTRQLHQATGNIRLPKTVLDQAAQDFVQRRPHVTEDDFHAWLTLLRLVTRLRGDTTATVEHWKETLALHNDMQATVKR